MGEGASLRVLYAHPSSLKANLPLGTDTVVSEALYNPVGEEMLEDEKEAKIRRASLMEKNFVDKDNVSGRTRVVRAIKEEGYRSGREFVQGGKSGGKQVVSFCAGSVVDNEWDPAARCKAMIVASKKDGVWKVSPYVTPSPLAAVNATYTSL